MAKMKAVMAAHLVMEKEGVTQAFGVPGAAINPLYSVMRERGTIAHVLARHVEGASHMAEGYTRAKAGNIGVCIGTSGPAGTDMITGLYSAIADSIPILCITGQAPRARLYKEDFQAVDIESISKPVTKWSVTVREPAQVPRAFQQAFHLMRSGRPGPVLIDLPFDVQMAEIEFDIDTYEPLPVYKPAATRKQIDQHGARAAAAHQVEGLLESARHERRLAHGDAPLGDGLADGLDVHGLEVFLVQPRPRRLAGDTQDGDAVGNGRVQAGDHVGASRAAGADAHTDVAGLGAAVALSHVRGPLDVARQDVADGLAFTQRRIQRVDRSTRHAEGLRDAFLLHHQNGGHGGLHLCH